MWKGHQRAPPPERVAAADRPQRTFGYDVHQLGIKPVERAEHIGAERRRQAHCRISRAGYRRPPDDPLVRFHGPRIIRRQKEQIVPSRGDQLPDHPKHGGYPVDLGKVGVRDQRDAHGRSLRGAPHASETMTSRPRNNAGWRHARPA